MKVKNKRLIFCTAIAGVGLAVGLGLSAQGQQSPDLNVEGVMPVLPPLDPDESFEFEVLSGERDTYDGVMLGEGLSYEEESAEEFWDIDLSTLDTPAFEVPSGD